MQVSSGRPHMLTSNQRGRGNEPVTVLGRIRLAVAVNIGSSDRYKLHATLPFHFDLPHSFRPSRPVLRPFNLRFQFFKSVECNGADMNVLKDPVEAKDEARFFKVRIGPANIWPTFINRTQISLERGARFHYAFYHKAFLEFVYRLLH